MSILLIHPSNKVLLKKDNLYTNESLTPSLGLGYVAAYCREKGISCKIIDLRLPHYNIENILDYIKKQDPVLIGITAFTHEITSAGRIAEILKEEFPKKKVFIGGPHATSIPEKTLKEFKGFDAVVIGEGEEALAEIYHTLNGNVQERLYSIPNLAVRRIDGIQITPSREPIKDINIIPVPAWDLFEIEHYSDMFMVSTSRGCPYPCNFCNAKYLGKTRTRDTSQVADEIEWLVKKYNASSIQFADATLSLLEKEAFKLCDELIGRGINKKIKWDCETRADSVSMELLMKMKEAGCKWIAYGVETGSERILEEVIKKGETKEDIIKAVNMTKKVGIKTRCFFILGHYTETVDSIKETIRFAIELNPDALSFGLMVPNPGTKLREMAERGIGGLRIIHNRWDEYNQFNYSCYELKDLPISELKKWQSKAYFSFYFHHPSKAIKLFIDESAYNYNIRGLLKIPLMLLWNRLKMS